MEAAFETLGRENDSLGLSARLREKFKGKILAEQSTCDQIPTVWVARENIVSLLQSLRDDSDPCYEMLFDLTAIDERMRTNRAGQPDSEFSVVYHLMSFSGNCDFRVKVPLFDADLKIPSVLSLWPSANWYEREAFDMYGINFKDHPDLRRILTDYGFEGHPLRKDFPLTGHTEVRYSEDKKKVIQEPVKLEQNYRNFDYESPWEGTKYIKDSTDKNDKKN